MPLVVEGIPLPVPTSTAAVITSLQQMIYTPTSHALPTYTPNTEYLDVEMEDVELPLIRQIEQHQIPTATVESTAQDLGVPAIIEASNRPSTPDTDNELEDYDEFEDGVPLPEPSRALAVIDPRIAPAKEGILVAFRLFTDLASYRIRPMGIGNRPSSVGYFGEGGELVGASESSVNWSLTAANLYAMQGIRLGFRPTREMVRRQDYYVDWRPLNVHPLLYDGSPDTSTKLGVAGLPFNMRTGRREDVNKYNWLAMEQVLKAAHHVYFENEAAQALLQRHPTLAPIVPVIQELRYEFEEIEAAPHAVAAEGDQAMVETDLGLRPADDINDRPTRRARSSLPTPPATPPTQPATPATARSTRRPPPRPRPVRPSLPEIPMPFVVHPTRPTLLHPSRPSLTAEAGTHPSRPTLLHHDRPSLSTRPSRRSRDSPVSDDDQQMDAGAEASRIRQAEGQQRRRLLTHDDAGNVSDREPYDAMLGIMKNYEPQIKLKKVISHAVFHKYAIAEGNRGRTDRLGDEPTPSRSFRITPSANHERLMVVRISTNRENPSQVPLVNWHASLQELLSTLERKGVTIDNRLNARHKGKVLTARNTGRFTGADDIVQENKSSRSTGESTQNQAKSMADADAERFLSSFYEHIGSNVPRFKVDAMIYGLPGKYRLSWHNGLRLVPNQANSKGARPRASLSVHKRVQWNDTLGSLIDITNEFVRTDRSRMEPQLAQRYDNFLTVFKQTADRFNLAGYKFRRPPLPALTAPQRPTLTMGEGLRGRGLRGAGKRGRPRGSGGAPYSIIQRKGRYYNLNDIQDSGLASAYIYKKLGSKFVRIPDLNAGVLNVCYPSRKKVGPKREISEPVKQMVKDLVYKQSISQGDQQLFKEILQVTHIEHAFQDELPDPLSTLKMEYDKLKGEVLMGNNNPSILKQLKVVTVGMYSRLISDNEFKQIITRLI